MFQNLIRFVKEDSNGRSIYCAKGNVDSGSTESIGWSLFSKSAKQRRRTPLKSLRPSSIKRNWGEGGTKRWTLEEARDRLVCDWVTGRQSFIGIIDTLSVSNKYILGKPRARYIPSTRFLFFFFFLFREIRDSKRKKIMLTPTMLDYPHFSRHNRGFKRCSSS